MLKTDLLKGHVPLGIALSGGSDSTALLILASEVLGAENLRAVTVDHGLRAGARAEAEQAASLCASLGVAHEIITLKLANSADLQARARAARYDTLSAWSARTGVAAIALGHTENDVAETFLMRLSRGSGVDGLAQMPERFSRKGTIYLRPLLNVPRAALREMLQSKNIAWSDDPSNEDRRFTRVQMRQADGAREELGLSTSRLSQTAKWMRAASEVLENAADDWIVRHARVDHGDAVFNQAALRAAPEETACRMFARALCNISGNPYRPRFSALEEALKSNAAMTLHGCLIYPHGDDLRITRELNAIKGQDPRWYVKNDLGTFVMRALAEVGLSQISDWRETALLPRRSLLSSPAIWDGNRVVAAPFARPDPDWDVTIADPLKRAAT